MRYFHIIYNFVVMLRIFPFNLYYYNWDEAAYFEEVKINFSKHHVISFRTNQAINSEEMSPRRGILFVPNKNTLLLINQKFHKSFQNPNSESSRYQTESSSHSHKKYFMSLLLLLLLLFSNLFIGHTNGFLRFKSLLESHSLQTTTLRSKR
jgi:hypothetical protein